MKRALVVGYGSIGKLHESVLLDLGYEVHIVSQHTQGLAHHYSTLDDAFTHDFDYIVIASKTFDHKAQLQQVLNAGHTAKLLVEKPLFNNTDKPVDGATDNVFVGYNLRFHPCVVRARELLKDKQVLSAHHYVGQHLSLWRPSNDYMQSYSAQKEQGGGVLRDLSHELDLIQFLFGDVNEVKAMGGKVGDVTVDAEDAYGILTRHENCPLVSMQMNCLDWQGSRVMKIVCQDMSIELDFSNHKLRIAEKVEQFEVERATTYKAMHEEILTGEAQTACNYANGMKVMQLIRDIENA